MSILSPNGNYSTSTAIANQTPADFDLDFQLINHNHLALNSGLPMHTMNVDNDAYYGQVPQYNALINPIVSNPLIHYSTSLVSDSPAMTMHSKLATLDMNTRTLSSASTATVDTRQMLENTNCDVQSVQYN